MSCVTLSLRAASQGSPRTQIRTPNHQWLIDEPRAFGGEDTAPSPVEMLLASLAGCVSAAGHLIAQEMGVEIQSLEIDVKGNINSQVFLGTAAEESRAGFQQITMAIKAKADWAADQQEQWLKAVCSRCPIIDNLIDPTPLVIHFA